VEKGIILSLPLTYLQLQNIIFLSQLDEVKMVKIRLRRVGAKKKPQYRLVVADACSLRDGAFIDIIGHYNPLTDPET